MPISYEDRVKLYQKRYGKFAPTTIWRKRKSYRVLKLHPRFKEFCERLESDTARKNV